MTKILAVDDSPSIRSMLSFTLRQAGYTPVAAEDGRQGLEEAEKDQFDLVITDINMPVMNGIELIEALRKLPQYKFTPILVLSTESGSEKKNLGKQAGATGWLVKPFDPDQLLSVIARVIN